MKKNTCVFLLFISILNNAAFTQHTHKEKLDSLFAGLAANNRAMGSIAISKNGNILYQNSIGYSLYSNTTKIVATQDSKYRIGSISKIYTATIIFQLIEEGKLSLTTTLDEFFPKYPHASEITISHLLNHRTGIRNVNSINSKETARSDEEMLRFIAQKKSKFKPGSAADYSNSNFLILGYIIEKICHHKYAGVLQERIVSKLHLANTYYGYETPASNECYPYKFVKDWEQQTETNLSIPGASGGLVSSPAEMVNFIEALFANKLITKNSVDKMRTITDGFGMGLLPFEYDKRIALGHYGGIDGFECLLAYFPEDSLAIAYCTNGIEYPVKSIVIGALNICYDNFYIIPDFKTATIKATRPGRYTGVYISTASHLKITITQQKGELIASTNNAPPYQLQAIANNIFRNDEVSVILEFDPTNNAMNLKRGETIYAFSRESSTAKNSSVSILLQKKPSR